MRSVLVPLALFVATCFTTTVAGGASYSIPLMAILVCHEFGHYFAARAHGVSASLPHFIPMPPPFLLGTMGAVIFQSETPDRRKLIDIGAAGPLAGLVVAIPVLFYGLTLSEVKPISAAGLQEGNSLLYALLKFGAKGIWLPGNGQDVILHPTAWAGWAGLLVTMVNLIPIGQLDGGHIAIAYFGNRYLRASRVIHLLLPVLALGLGFLVASEAGFFWMLWAGLLFLMKWLARGQYHPPVDDRPLSRSRAALFWVVCVAFAAIFMPVPLMRSQP